MIYFSYQNILKINSNHSQERTTSLSSLEFLTTKFFSFAKCKKVIMMPPGLIPPSMSLIRSYLTYFTSSKSIFFIWRIFLWSAKWDVGVWLPSVWNSSSIDGPWKSYKFCYSGIAVYGTRWFASTFVSLSITMEGSGARNSGISY